MKTSALLAALVVVLTIVPARADAQHLQLQMQNGLVTLDAQNVSVRQILAEWARVGGARIINGEKVLGAPVTLQLSGVSERQALDTILRGVSGYMLAARQDATSGLSQFDRILIMPTSSAPRANPAPATATFNPRPMPTQPAPEPVETEVVEDEDQDQEEEPGDPGDPEVVEEAVQPQPGINRGGLQRPPHFPNPMGGAQPFTPQPFPSAPQPVQSDEDGPPGQQPATSPLNVPPGASTTPGVISPVPQQDPQNPNPRPRRPPR